MKKPLCQSGLHLHFGCSTSCGSIMMVHPRWAFVKFPALPRVGRHELRDSYKVESDLVEDFRTIITNTHSKFAITAIASEFNYIEGKVDLIAKDCNGDLVTFEAKLSRWRKALNQAYRNSSFSHYSYVILPENTIINASSNIAEFSRRGVGLCSIGASGLKITIPAIRTNPIQPWLTDKALRYINGRKQRDRPCS